MATHIHSDKAEQEKMATPAGQDPRHWLRVGSHWQYAELAEPSDQEDPADYRRLSSAHGAVRPGPDCCCWLSRLDGL